MAIIQNPDVQTIKALPCHVLFEKNILVGEDNSLPRIYELYAFVDPVPEKPADHHLPDMEPDFFFEKDFDIAVLGLKISPNEGLLRELNLHFISLREYFSYHNEDEVFKAARARALFEWKSKNHYCSNCGKRLFLLKDLTALECSRCNLQYFPRIEPCVIVLVRRGEEMLLARHAQRNQDIYACIAGFIEAGETAEQAVHREVFEETGIKIKNLTYKGSQGWPFPDQLMLAFTAEYDSGEIRLQESEIAEAGWFTKDKLPQSPAPGSVAYRLIHDLF